VNSYRESYRLDSLSERSCRLYRILEVGGIPTFGEFFLRQPMQDEQPQIMARLKSIVASRAYGSANRWMSQGNGMISLVHSRACFLVEGQHNPSLAGDDPCRS
jgi:hypothetical protein